MIFKVERASGKRDIMEDDAISIVEINTIEELMDFVDSKGELIISAPNHITIYDSYVE